MLLFFLRLIFILIYICTDGQPLQIKDLDLDLDLDQAANWTCHTSM